MGHGFQVCVDCSDPHALAAWWAATLDWQVEAQDEGFIRQMVDGGYATDAETRVVDGRLVWRSGCAIEPREGERPGPWWPRVLFQEVPEAKTVKNRLHLDLRTGLTGDDLEAFRARLVERGATKVGEGRQGPHAWVVFTDPEGNEFCV